MYTETVVITTQHTKCNLSTTPHCTTAYTIYAKPVWCTEWLEIARMMYYSLTGEDDIFVLLYIIK